MPEISVDDLLPGSVLKEDLYHIGTGKILLKKGEHLSEQKFEIIESLDLENVFKSPSQNEVDEFLQKVKFEEKTLTSEMKGESFEEPVFDKRGRVLIEEGVPLNDSLMNLIKKSGGVVYFAKVIDEDQEKIVKKYFDEVSKIQSVSTADNPAVLENANIKDTEFDFDKSDMIDPEVEINAGMVDQDLAKRKKPKRVEISSEDLIEMGVKDPLVKRTDEYKTTFNDTYLDLVGELDTLFKNALNKETGNLGAHVRNICNRVVNTLIADKNFVINLTNLREENENYLIRHSLNTTIFAINIGCSLGYSEKQVFELAFGALLADIGMIKVPKEILEKKDKLTPDEFKEVQKHPAHSLDYLNLIKGLPSTLPYIVYQSHEKIDGSGYPKNRPAFLIHENAKIIAIADAFDALCADRPWRKGLIPYKAMEEVIKMAGQKKLDGKIIRQWLFSISLFPVGSFVTLNDSSVSKVISANPADFTRPNLRILMKDGEKLETHGTVILSDAKDLKITHAINKDEVDLSVSDGF
ncbi:MAG: hypothetical protein COA79_24310 [Planctomycetota bacterium]|nr:MAG: hypothetical protein COA79_24310 [Planctomycetota bacterium]